LISSDLWQEIEKLKERNRQLRLKIGEERRQSIEKTSELEHQIQNFTQRLQAKQIRLDELEIQSEQIETLRRSLENSDRLVTRKNQELQAMGGVLAAINQKISDRDTEIERLESELAVHRSPTQLETSATVGTDLSEIEAADHFEGCDGAAGNFDKES
jgi:predicted RNase H-like nuclease (RuvC/YqgF family)